MMTACANTKSGWNALASATVSSEMTAILGCFSSISTRPILSTPISQKFEDYVEPKEVADVQQFNEMARHPKTAAAITTTRWDGATFSNFQQPLRLPYFPSARSPKVRS